MYGIPNMKLEKWVVKRRTDLMKAEGVQFEMNADIGKTIPAQEILNQYDAVILACGSSNPRDINAPGRDAEGIYFAVDFLKATTKSLLDSAMADDKYILCPALCEKACTCGLNGEPVTVKENENAIVEFGFETGLIKAEPPKVRSGKKIAVIGSGPSGLAAADTLNRRGHSVTVYELSLIHI